jgi:hypothetical protein
MHNRKKAARSDSLTHKRYADEFSCENAKAKSKEPLAFINENPMLDLAEAAPRDMIITLTKRRSYLLPFAFNSFFDLSYFSR